MLKVFRILTVFALILWMVFIFSLSSQNASESSKTSGSVIVSVLRILDSDFDDLPKSEQKEIVSRYQFIIRKSAHFGAYFILGALSFASLATYKKPKFALKIFLSTLICLAYAVSDEYHQTLIPGRSGEIRDVLIDLCGSALAIFILTIIVLLAKNNKTNKGVNGMRKKKLIELNEELFKRNENSLLSLEKAKKENEQLKKELEEAKSEIERLKVVETKTEPLKNLEQKVISQISLPSDTEFAAEIIGKIIVKSTEHCNALTCDSKPTDNKELVNLILGRTEVAKAEILNIVMSEMSFDMKKVAILDEQKATEDYFLSVMAQKD